MKQINNEALRVLIGFTPIELGETGCSEDTPYHDMVKNNKSSMTYDDCIQYAKSIHINLEPVIDKCNEITEIRELHRKSVKDFWEGTEEELEQRLMNLFPYEQVIRYIY